MADLVPQKLTRAGTALAFVAAAAGGDRFPRDPRGYLHVKNGGGAPINVTLNSVKNCDQGFDHDEVVAVPAGGERLIGGFADDRFADAQGYVNVTYSAVVTVTVAAVQV